MVDGIIFDVDGTILDSMAIWMDAGNIYLKSKGIQSKEDLGEKLFSMTMKEGAIYVKETYNLDLTPDEIIEGINETVFDFYKNDAEPKEGVKDFLEYAYGKGIPMTVATATDRPMIEVAFERLGLTKYFKKIYTTSEFGKGKDEPDIFIAAAEEMGSNIENTWVFEDAFYSLYTAQKEGFKTVGIFDFSSERRQDKVKSASDIYIKDWSDIKKLIKEMGM